MCCGLQTSMGAWLQTTLACDLQALGERLSWGPGLLEARCPLGRQSLHWASAGSLTKRHSLISLLPGAPQASHAFCSTLHSLSCSCSPNGLNICGPGAGFQACKALLGLAALGCPLVSWFSPWNDPGVCDLREDVFLWAIPRADCSGGLKWGRGLLQRGLGPHALWGRLLFSLP